MENSVKFKNKQYRMIREDVISNIILLDICNQNMSPQSSKKIGHGFWAILFLIYPEAIG